MRRLWRGAVPLLAAALGLARPAAAEPPAPAAGNRAVAASTEAEDDALSLPRVVPPRRRVVLEPIKKPTVAEAPADPVVQASATVPQPAVDLLAPPAAPPGWWNRSMPSRVPVVPSGPPAAPPPAPVGERAAAAPPAPPVLHPITTASRPARRWPAAFVTRAEPDAPQTVQAVHYEQPAEPPAPLPNPPDVDPPVLAELKQWAEAVYGREAAHVSVETQPDGCVRVRVRLRGAPADSEEVRTPEAPQTAGPVHILLEVER